MSKEENVINYPHSLDTRVALLEMCVSNISQTLIRLETKMDHNYANLETKMDRLDAKIEAVRRDVRADFRWLLTIFGGLLLGLSGTMAHGFHWF